MASLRKVYLVSHGDYSDYCIDAIYSSREMADGFVARMNETESGEWKDDGTFSIRSGHRIEEYDLDEPIPPSRTDGAFKADLILAGETLPDSIHIWWSTSSGAHDPATVERDYSKRLRVYGYGATREHAARSAREFARAILAGTVVTPRWVEHGPTRSVTFITLDPPLSVVDAAQKERETHGERAWDDVKPET